MASLKDFLSRDAAIAIILFVVLFKLADALATAMNTTFALKIGFSRVELAAILKGVGFAAALLGGFAGGFVARSFRSARAFGSAAFCKPSRSCLFRGRPSSATISRG